jgi:hypothetical protein
MIKDLCNLSNDFKNTIENVEDKIDCYSTINYGCPSPNDLNSINGVRPYYIEVVDNSPVSPYNKKCVFLLLGNFAKAKSELITSKNSIITAVHPSPFSANNGFFNSGIFKKIEEKIGKNIN